MALIKVPEDPVIHAATRLDMLQTVRMNKEYGAVCLNLCLHPNDSSFGEVYKVLVSVPPYLENLRVALSICRFGIAIID